MALSFTQLTTNKVLPFLPRNNLHRPSRPSSSSSSASATMMATVSNHQSYWTSINADVAAYLRRSLPKRAPLIVHEPMHDLVFSAPKTMAPAICIAACELVGGQRSEAAVAAACAINLVHAAAYTHEHLPNLLERHTAPAAYGPNIKVLAGDAISPLCFELLARSGDQSSSNSERILRVIVEIARGMGAQGMVEGQYMHVKWANLQGPDVIDDRMAVVESVCKKKEGALYACAAACGGILGGGSEEEVEKLRRFGLYMGMIFGMLYGVGREESDGSRIAKGLVPLAFKELEGFQGRKVSELRSLVDFCFDSSQ